MARFIIPTLEAVAAGDISSADACYNLLAHLTSVDILEGNRAPLEQDLRRYVKTVVLAAADGSLPALPAARRLIGFKEKLAAGIPMDEILKTEVETFTENQ